MKTATITEAKNGLSALLDQVKAGQAVLITDRGIPIARLEPIAADPEQTGLLERLERGGVIRRALRPPPMELLSRPGPRLPDGVSAVETLLEERHSGW